MGFPYIPDVSPGLLRVSSGSSGSPPGLLRLLRVSSGFSGSPPAGGDPEKRPLRVFFFPPCLLRVSSVVAPSFLRALSVSPPAPPAASPYLLRGFSGSGVEGGAFEPGELFFGPEETRRASGCFGPGEVPEKSSGCFSALAPGSVGPMLYSFNIL